MFLKGFKVAETEKAIAFVAEKDAATVGIKPLWLPLKKIVDSNELDELDKRIETAQGTKKGIPMALAICDEFAKKVGM